MTAVATRDLWQPGLPAPDAPCVVCGAAITRTIHQMHKKLCGKAECWREHKRRYDLVYRASRR